MVANRADDGLYMTVAQYLTLDEATDGKYEYIDGYAFMLRPPSSIYDDHQPDIVGGSVAHAALCARLATLVNVALGDSPCMAYTSDARMKLAERQYLYPDVTVSCGEEAGSMLAHPRVIIEVLSPATEKRDRGGKFKSYKALPSVQEYVLVGSEAPTIEVYRREGDFWPQYLYSEGDMVELKSLEIRFSFDEVYRRIPL
jgi:Uma2 family endonuclease